MATELVQRRRFQRRRYVLLDDGIRTSESTIISGKTYVVPYDVMFADRMDIRAASQEAFWLALAALGAAILCAFGYLFGAEDIEWYVAPLAALAAIPFGAYFWISRGDLVWFNDGSSSFWVVRDQPSVEVVEAFLDEARSRARDRLRSRLLPLVRTPNEYADREHASALRDKGIISEAEFDEYLRDRTRREEPN
jgi:hypothetical protein